MIRVKRPSAPRCLANWWRFVGLILVVGGWGLTVPLARGGEAELARFTAEYPRSAKRRIAVAERARGAGRITRTGPGGQTADDEFRFAIDHGYTKLELYRKGTTGDTGKPWYVVCLWEGEAYELKWSPGSSSYQVVHAGPPAGQGSSIFNYSLHLGRFLEAPFALFGRRLLGLLELPGTRVLGAEKATVKGRSLIRVDLETDLGQARGFKAEMTAELEPELDWAVVGGEFRVGQVPVFRLDVAYPPHAGADAEPVEATIVEGYSPGRVDSSGTRWRCRFESISHSPTPLDEFSMSHYGLPVIVGPGSETAANGGGFSGGPWAVVGIAALGLIGAGVLWRMGAHSPTG